MTYTVKYKQKGSLWFRHIRNVKGDGVLDTKTHRWFVCDNEQRYEIPVDGTVFVFSTNRFLVIKQNMERTAGQSLPI